MHRLGGNPDQPRLWCNGNPISLTNVRALLFFDFERDEHGKVKTPKVATITPVPGTIGWQTHDSEGRPIQYLFEVDADLLQRPRDEFRQKVARARADQQAADLARAIEQEQPTRRRKRPSRAVQDAEIDAYVQAGQPEPEPKRGRRDEADYDWSVMQANYNDRRNKGQKNRLGIDVRADYLKDHDRAPDERHIRKRCAKHYTGPN